MSEIEVHIKYGEIIECPDCGCCGTLHEQQDYLPEDDSFYAILYRCDCGGHTITFDYPFMPVMFHTDTIFRLKWKVEEGNAQHVSSY